MSLRRDTTICKSSFSFLVNTHSFATNLYHVHKCYYNILYEQQQLWGQYYRDVLATPDKDDHQNIRNFMKYGWDGVDFSQNGIALTKKVGTDGWDWDAESFIP